VETTEMILIRKSPQATSLWCSQCGMKAEMLSVEEAVTMLNISPRSVYRWLEAGRVHYCESEKGTLRICLPSLSLLLEQAPEDKVN
jgi:hypothetical protein